MKLFGPVFQKELLELARRRSTYTFRVVAGAALLAVVFLYYNESDHAKIVSITKRQAAVGGAVFENWMWIQFWVVCGLMPLLVCGLVSAEREAGSLELLFTTHLTDREIILGKLASRLFFMVLLVFSAMPVLILVGLLGGIEFNRLFKLYLVTASAGLLVAAIGMYLSTVSKRPWVACLQTYLVFVFLWGLVPFSVIAGGELLYSLGILPPLPRTSLGTLLLVAIAPYLSAYLLTSPDVPPMVLVIVSWDRIQMYCLIWTALAAFFLVFAIRELRIGPRPSRIAGLLGSLLRRPFVRRNAMPWIGRRREVFDPDGHLFRLHLLAWPMSLAMAFYFINESPRPNLTGLTFVLTCQTAFLHLAIANVGASAIARERQRGSLDLLLLTRLPAASIILGAFFGVFLTCLPTLLLLGVTIFAAVKFYTFSTAFALEYAVVVFGCTMTLLASAVLISLSASRPSHAVAATVAIALLYWFLPLPLGVGQAFFRTISMRMSPSEFIAYTVGFAVLLGTAVIGGVTVLMKKNPFRGAIAASLVIPWGFLFALPPNGRLYEASSFWRWVQQVRHADRSALDGPVTMNPVFWASFAAAVMIVLFALFNGGRLLGRLEARPGPPRRYAALAGMPKRTLADSA
jgi:ABC-type transport system involved in multi-copper enzyme maturation permease subunit